MALALPAPGVRLVISHRPLPLAARGRAHRRSADRGQRSSPSPGRPGHHRRRDHHLDTRGGDRAAGTSSNSATGAGATYRPPPATDPHRRRQRSTTPTGQSSRPQVAASRSPSRGARRLSSQPRLTTRRGDAGRVRRPGGHVAGPDTTADRPAAKRTAPRVTSAKPQRASSARRPRHRRRAPRRPPPAPPRRRRPGATTCDAGPRPTPRIALTQRFPATRHPVSRHRGDVAPVSITLPAPARAPAGERPLRHLTLRRRPTSLRRRPRPAPAPDAAHRAAGQRPRSRARPHRRPAPAAGTGSPPATGKRTGKADHRRGHRKRSPRADLGRRARPQRPHLRARHTIGERRSQPLGGLSLSRRQSSPTTRPARLVRNRPDPVAVAGRVHRTEVLDGDRHHRPVAGRSGQQPVRAAGQRRSTRRSS